MSQSDSYLSQLILVIYEYTQCNDNQCLRYLITVGSVACLFKAISDLLP
jgi:hypothetical protein